jgi:hypothetical protein
MKRSSALIGFSAILLGASAATAAPISWSAPTAITSAEQSLFSTWQIQYAVAWGADPQTVTLTGGQNVAFTAGSIDGSGVIGVTGAVNITPAGTANYFGTSNAAFNAVLSGFAYDSTHNITLTGLTVGHSYSIQLFSLDNRAPFENRFQTFQDQSGNSSAAFLHVSDDFVIGSFIASGSTQLITGLAQNVSCGGDGLCTNLNAAVLRAVPEPATWAMMVVGFGLVGAASRRRVQGYTTA